MDKKGQIFEQFGALATGVVALAILLVVAFMIMSEGKVQIVDLMDTTTVSNETIVVTNGTRTLLFNGNCIEGLACTAMHNNSLIMGSGNYSCTDSWVNISEDNGGVNMGFSSTQVNISYSCKVRDEAYNSTDTLQNATDDIPTWVPIIIIVFIGAILLGLVALLRRSQRGR